MIGAATRSRLFELRRDRSAARRSAELLDRKREVLLREIARRERMRRALQETIDRDYARAVELLDAARVDVGLATVEAAALAQPEVPPVTHRDISVMGVRVAELQLPVEPFRACYGAAATAGSVDDCAIAFTQLLPSLVTLTQEIAAIRSLSAAMRKTSKLLNALQKIVLPRIDREIHTIVDGIEEDERDDALRRNVALRMR